MCCSCRCRGNPISSCDVSRETWAERVVPGRLLPAVQRRAKPLLATLRRAFVVAAVWAGIGVVVTGLFVFSAILWIVRKVQQ